MDRSRQVLQIADLHPMGTEAVDMDFGMEIKPQTQSKCRARRCETICMERMAKEMN